MCNQCKHLKAAGCNGRVRPCCEHFGQIIERPDITGCSMEEREEDERDE